jgi:ketosteroid isomerase-like protein
MNKQMQRHALNKKLVDAYFDAWNSLNTDDPAVFYAKDKGFSLLRRHALRIPGWDKYKKGVEKNCFGRISGAKLTRNNDLRIVRRGRVAWMSLSFHLSLVLKAGGVLDFDCRHTAIWERRRGNWLIVHEHISKPVAN